MSNQIDDDLPAKLQHRFSPYATRTSTNDGHTVQIVKKINQRKSNKIH